MPRSSLGTGFLALFLVAFVCCCMCASAGMVMAQDRTDFLSFRLGALKLRYGVYDAAPGTTPRADLLYFHGFADRLDNHDLLFRQLNAQGIRVLAFDYPQHGETHGLANLIDLYEFTDLAEFAGEVEKVTRQDARRPLLLGGWSTGGLAAIRCLQHKSLASKFSSRTIQGALLFAPGVYVKTLVGHNGQVTLDTLTSNPSPMHKGPIAPKSPLLTPKFATKLLFNSKLAQHQSFLEPDLPMLVFVAGNDKYVQSDSLKKWILEQEDEAVNIRGVVCDSSKHELDNEIEPLGAEVRSAAVSFVDFVVSSNGAESVGEWQRPRNAGLCRDL